MHMTTSLTVHVTRNNVIIIIIIHCCAVYGLTHFGVCWVHPQTEFANGYMWGFFYGPVLFIYSWSFYTLVYARRRLSKGLRDTYEARMRTFSNGSSFVLGYTMFWTLVAVVYWAGLDTPTGPDMSPAAWIFALLFTSKGVATMVVWLNNSDLRAVAAADRVTRARDGPAKINRQLQPHLNLALRKEVLHYTTLAIRLSVVQSVGSERTRAVMQSMREQLVARRRAAGLGQSAPPTSPNPQSSAAPQSTNAAGHRRAQSEPRGAGHGVSSLDVSTQDPHASPTSDAAMTAASVAAGTFAGDGRSGRPPVRGLVSASAAYRSQSVGAAAATKRGTSPPSAASVAVEKEKGTDGAAAAIAAALEVEDITARASVHAPRNDTRPGVGDEQLNIDWRPLEIALYAPLFERGGLYDLGDVLGQPGAANKPSGVSSTTAASSNAAATRISNPLAAAAANNSKAQATGVSSTAGVPSGRLPRDSSAAAQLGGGGGEDREAHVNITPTSVDSSGVIKRPPLELRDLAPEVFARIRDLYHITPAQYLYSLSRTTKERFSEGASGAFMCFSHDMRFVIKTMEKDEADVLQRILRPYLSYVRAHRDTLIIKFFGCMSLRLYRQTLYFVVMENIFPTRATIHERFDLKGSWVGRSASKGMPGTMAYCRYCNESFKVGAKTAEYCKARPNRHHVANTVLKVRHRAVLTSLSVVGLRSLVCVRLCVICALLSRWLATPRCWLLFRPLVPRTARPWLRRTMT